MARQLTIRYRADLFALRSAEGPPREGLSAEEAMMEEETDRTASDLIKMLHTIPTEVLGKPLKNESDRSRQWRCPRQQNPFGRRFAIGRARSARCHRRPARCGPGSKAAIGAESSLWVLFLGYH